MSREKICFYRVNDAYGCFSNFAPYPISVDGKVWPTSEHYFQAMKFLDAAHAKKIRETKSPMIAARMGRDRTVKIHADWNSRRDNVMYKAICAKFTQHEDLRAMLLETGNATLVEHTANDGYWGDGGDGSGKNRLGELLMKLRDALRGKKESPSPPKRSAAVRSKKRVDV